MKTQPFNDLIEVFMRLSTTLYLCAVSGQKARLVKRACQRHRVGGFDGFGFGGLLLVVPQVSVGGAPTYIAYFLAQIRTVD